MTENRLIVAQLAADSPPGMLLPWARSRGLEVDIVRPDLGDTLPHLCDAVGVVLVGADASVSDAWLSWMAPVRRWTAEALATDVPVLGLGLGAQIIAAVLGGEVERAPSPEVGWISVAGDDPGIADGPWIAYNQDTIVLPAWATTFNARGTQAFRTGPHLGVQFAPHATPDMVRAWAANGRYAVPAELAEELSERIALVARHTRALFSSWALQAGIAPPTEPLPLAVAR